jgi:hypothetical protein
MELFIPSLLIVFAALVVIAGLLPNVSPFFIATSALILLIYTGYTHNVMFSHEYKNVSWFTSIHNTATPFLITVIVLFSIGWLLNLFTGYRPNFFTVPKVAEQPSTTAFYRKFL